MKAKDLKRYLEQLPKSELSTLTLELYQSLSKRKKQDFQLKLLLATTVHKSSKKQLSFALEKLNIEQFVKNAHLLHYFYPNEVITTKERKNWTAPVEKWFKSLTNTTKKKKNLIKRAELLEQLYVVLCDACEQEYFLCEDPFQALRITQIEFYKATLGLWAQAAGKEVLINKGIELLIFNPLNSYTLYSQLMVAYSELLQDDILYRTAIDQALALLAENNFNPHRRSVVKQSVLSVEDYWHEQVHNNLVELIYRLYTLLGHLESAIDFFKKNYYERKEEIRLYVLVRLLFEDGNVERIQHELEKAIEEGIEPRASLMQLLESIAKKETLPHYI